MTSAGRIHEDLSISPGSCCWRLAHLRYYDLQLLCETATSRCLSQPRQSSTVAGSFLVGAARKGAGERQMAPSRM